MALGTYTELRSSVLAWLARNNSETDPVYIQFQDFVTLAEKRFLRRLRVRCMETRLEAPINERIEGLPARFLELENLSVTTAGGSRYSLTQVTQRQLRDLWSNESQQGDPWVYSLVGNEIHFGPWIEYDVEADPDDLPTMELSGFTAPVALTEARPTNDILTEYPDVYLYACLVEASAFLVSEQLPDWVSAMNAAIDAANDDFESSQGLQIQSPVSSYLII